jgi:predicted nucleotidyltransferase
MKTIPTELLQEITRRLVAEFEPEQVILFGSHAWGMPSDDSDVDLLVIIADSHERPAQRSTRAYRSLRGLMVPTDVIVKTRAEINHYRHVRASLEGEALELGKVLYG